MAAAVAAAAASSSSSTLLKKSPIQTHRFISSSSLRFPCSFSSFLASSLSISHAQESPSLFLRSSTHKRVFRTLAVVEEEPIAAAEPAIAESVEEGNGDLSEEAKVQVTPCELYVCNIPRSCDISELFEIFKPYGTVRSVEVSRNSETGISRGSGYVTMSSMPEAKAAITALDGSDLGGREVRVRFSADLFSRRKNVDSLNSAPKNVCFESPYKAYVGNLAWSVKPEDMSEHFSQFGSVVSARVLYDRKGGKSRVYGFVSFSSAEELEAAISSSGTEFRGRQMLVREVMNKESAVLS